MFKSVVLNIFFYIHQISILCFNLAIYLILRYILYNFVFHLIICSTLLKVKYKRTVELNIGGVVDRTAHGNKVLAAFLKEF